MNCPLPDSPVLRRNRPSRNLICPSKTFGVYAKTHGVIVEVRCPTIGSGANGETSSWSLSSFQKSSGTTVFIAALSSAMRSGLLAPGMTAALAG